MANGFVKMFRQFEDWEWYQTPNTFRVFVHILFNAVYRETTFQGVTIPVGSYATTYEKICQKLKISKSQARTAISHLKSTGEITLKIAPKFMVIHVQNWAKYQSEEVEVSTQNNTQNSTQIASKKKKVSTQIALSYEEELNKDYEEEKKNKDIITPNQKNVEKLVFGEYKHVNLTLEEYDRLHKDYKNADELIKYLDAYIEEKGDYKTKNHNLTIRRWVVTALGEQKRKEMQQNYQQPKRTIKSSNVQEGDSDDPAFYGAAHVY